MTQKDLRGRTVFQIAAENSLYQVLETPEIGVIVKKMWNGRLSHDGVMASSSLYKYLDESASKLNNPFEKFEEMDFTKCYFYQLSLWCESCSMRYWPESISTILLIILYNIYIYLLVNKGQVMKTPDNLDPTILFLLRLYILWTVCINFNIVNQYIFCKLAKRKFNLDLWGMIEIFMMLCAFSLLLDTNKIFGVNDSNGNLIESNEMSDFSFIFRALILSINDIFVWLRITGILLTFKDFGPLIRMISLLSLLTAKYLIVYCLYITCFSAIFTAIFYRNSEQFSSFSITFATLFGGFINNLDAFNFNGYKVFGAVMLIFYVTLSGIILINVLIALLINAYKTLSLVVDASHRTVLITYYRRYKWDFEYGFMILSTTPLNILNLITVPVFLILSKKYPLHLINENICKIYHVVFYFPIMLLISILYNILLFPICYIKGIIDIMTYEFYSRNSLPFKIFNIFKWLLLGPPFMCMIFLRDILNLIRNIFNKIEIPSSEKNRIKNHITNDDVILLLQFIHNRSKEDQNDLHTLFIDFLYFEQEKKAEIDNSIKEKSFYINKINSISNKSKSNRKNSSYFMINKTKKLTDNNNMSNTGINTFNKSEEKNKPKENSSNYVKRNIIVIEILENFLIDDGSDNYIVDIQKFKMLLPKTWHIDDRYIKRLVFTEITSLNRAVNNLKSTKNVIIQYQLLNTITNSMIKLDKSIDDSNEKLHENCVNENDEFEEKQFYYDIVDILGKVSLDLKNYIDSSNSKNLSKKISIKATLMDKEHKEINKQYRDNNDNGRKDIFAKYRKE